MPDVISKYILYPPGGKGSSLSAGILNLGRIRIPNIEKQWHKILGDFLGIPSLYKPQNGDWWRYFDISKFYFESKVEKYQNGSSKDGRKGWTKKYLTEKQITSCIPNREND